MAVLKSLSDFEGSVYHATGGKHYVLDSPLCVGQIFKVGEMNNPFFSFYEGKRVYPVDTPQGKIEVPAIKFLNGVRRGEINCPNLSVIACEIANHFCMLARELILEEVRKQLVADAPSRMKCLWVADSKESAIKWAKICNCTHISKLEIKGKIIETDSNLIMGDSIPLSEVYANARKYWLGEQSEFPSIETLFSGTAKVIDIFPVPS